MKVTKIQTLNDTTLYPVTICVNALPQNLKTIPSTMYDVEFLSKYGNRKVTSYIKKLFSDAAKQLYQTDEVEINNSITAQVGLSISYIVNQRFKDKWEKLWQLLNKEYDPLSPFDITLSETSSDNLKTIKDSTTYSDSNGIYGFNSTESSPSDNSSGTSDKEYERDIARGRDYTRKGNIGNTTRQELVRQEREVLQYQIIDTIFKDIVSVFCRASFG